MPRTVRIECFQGVLATYDEQCWVVGVDVIRATTTAVTAIATGRRCFVAESLEAALSLAGRLHDPLLVGELAGTMPQGFDATNSPAELAVRDDTWRPMVLLSSSGTKLLCQARGQAVYAACLRNLKAQVQELLRHDRDVILIGAGSRGAFREEDQLCCAWIAEALIRAGYNALGPTSEIVARWSGAPLDALTNGQSARYLESTGQLRDLEFILGHVDDVDDTFILDGHEIVLKRALPASA